MLMVLKQMKKFHFNVKAIPEIPEKKECNCSGHHDNAGMGGMY